MQRQNIFIQWLLRLWLFTKVKIKIGSDITMAIGGQQLGNTTTLTVQHWQPEQLTQLQASYPALQVEYLSLEEIFLELNR